MRTFNLLLAFLEISFSVQFAGAQDPCECSDNKAPKHYRYRQKHETDFDRFPLSKDTITASTIIKWEKQYKDIREKLKTRPLDQPRVENTPEETLYVLKGYMWYVKHEKYGESADCDFHIEIGPQNKTGKRVIVELTNDDCRAQREVLEYVKSLGYSLKKEFSKGVPCIVIGLGFYDRVHGPSSHGRKGKTTHTSWELHPVRSIQFRIK